MCLGVFMGICSIVRVGAANVVYGHMDVTWILLWVEIEACLAVIVVSLMAFRTLFTSNTPNASPIEARRLCDEPAKRKQYDIADSSMLYPSKVPQSPVMLGKVSDSAERSRQLHAIEINRSDSDAAIATTLPIERPSVAFADETHQEGVSLSIIE